MDGIININKPSNMTSHDVVRDMRRLLGIKKIGHTGTLDPMATGVLPICVGKATRIMDYLDLDFKMYKCTMVLGKTTDTQDIWGELLEEKSTDQICEKDIRYVLGRFSGVVEQKPPMYSAVRISGKRLYEYARAGRDVEVKTRKAYIKPIEIIDMDLKGEEKKITFTVECSKGTYIRTICYDVGQILGCGATMESLVRLKSGAFLIEDSIDLEKIKTMSREDIQALVLPADFPLVHFGKAVLSREMGKKFVDGWHIPLSDCQITKEPTTTLPVQTELGLGTEYRKAYNLYMPADEQSQGKEENVFLGVAIFSEKYKKLVCDKVFYRSSE